MPTREHRDEGYIGPPQDPLRGWRLGWNKEPRYAGVDLEETLERHRQEQEIRRHRARRGWRGWLGGRLA